MTTRLGGPHPGVEIYTHLPNPLFGDSENTTHTVEKKRSIDNTRYTYVKTRDTRRRLSMRFNLTQAKAFELLEFVRAYHRTQIEIADHPGQVWFANITTSPNEVESQATGIKNSAIMFGHGIIQIEFEGTIQ